MKPPSTRRPTLSSNPALDSGTHDSEFQHLTSDFLRPLRPLPVDVQREYNTLQGHFQIDAMSAVLDVGTDPDIRYANDNPLLKHHFGPNLVCTGPALEQPDWALRFPVTPYKVMFGTRLPFEDKSFDVVVCRHFIEHLGDRARQVQLITECIRVARRGIYLTTQDRWRFIEANTLLPLLHWLPQSAYAKLLRLFPSRYRVDHHLRHGLCLFSQGDLHALALDAVCSFKRAEAMPFWMERNTTVLGTDLHLIFAKRLPMPAMPSTSNGLLHRLDTDKASDN